MPGLLPALLLLCPAAAWAAGPSASTASVRAVDAPAVPSAPARMRFGRKEGVEAGVPAGIRVSVPVSSFTAPASSATLPSGPAEAAPIIPRFEPEPGAAGTEDAAPARADAGFEEPVFIEDLTRPPAVSTAAAREEEPGVSVSTPSRGGAPSLSTAAARPPRPAPEAAPVVFPEGLGPVRGLHLTSWVAGSRKARRRFLAKFEGTALNAVVIPIKETDGKVYLPGVPAAQAAGTTRIAIPKPEELLADLKERGIRAIARQVVFADDALPRKRPAFGVRDAEGGLWENRRGLTWADPYLPEVWSYNLDIAEHALELGFDEVQFDYIRFPADGDTRRCRYSNVHHSSTATVQALDDFLRAARERLGPLGKPLSIAVFGLTTTSKGDMGIGQNIRSMEGWVEAVSPMMYPSHYAKGEYGITDPNKDPYEVIRLGLRDAKRRLGPEAYKLRPYFQDFSLGFRYRTEQVRAQIRAAEELGIRSWIFWNPVNRYHWDAFRDEPPASAVSPPSR